MLPQSSPLPCRGGDHDEGVLLMDVEVCVQMGVKSRQGDVVLAKNCHTLMSSTTPSTGLPLEHTARSTSGRAWTLSATL